VRRAAQENSGSSCRGCATGPVSKVWQHRIDSADNRSGRGGGDMSPTSRPSCVFSAFPRADDTTTRLVACVARQTIRHAGLTFKSNSGLHQVNKIGHHTPAARRCEERRKGASVRPMAWTPPASSRPSISISPTESRSTRFGQSCVRRESCRALQPLTHPPVTLRASWSVSPSRTAVGGLREVTSDHD